MSRVEADLRDETTRVEAFSDGVFAIAMTLLILEIRVPEHVASGELLRALGALWPSFLAFVASFVTIGIMWMNHHRLFNLIGKSDQALLVSNLLLMLCITFVPFPTALVPRASGRERRRGPLQRGVPRMCARVPGAVVARAAAAARRCRSGVGRGGHEPISFRTASLPRAHRGRMVRTGGERRVESRPRALLRDSVAALQTAPVRVA